MTAVAPGAQAVAKELQAAGLSEAQVEAVTRVMRRAQAVDLSGPPTRAEMDALRSSVEALRADRTGTAGPHAIVRAEADGPGATAAPSPADAAGIKSYVMKGVIGALVVQTAIVVGAIIVQTIIVVAAVVGLARTLTP